MSSLAEFGRRQSAKLQSLTRPQAVVLLVGTVLCLGVWVAAATGSADLAVALLAAVLGVLLVGVLHLSRWIGGVHRANQAAARDLRATVDQMQRRLVAAVETQRVVAGDRHAELAKTLRQAQRGTELMLRAQSREIEALFQLFDGFTPRAPMPSSGDFALNPTDLLELLHLIRSREPRLVLELGSGTSSVWIAYALERHGGRLISLDHDHGYAQKTRAMLAAHGLDAVATVRDAPLTGVPIGGSTYRWYDPTAVADLRNVDMLLVDGPPAATGPDARFPALHVLESRLAATATVVVDDANRPDEREAVRRWTETITGLASERSYLGRHAVLAYSRAEKSMAAATP
jgi:predicted O-methyltransferase YrrM/fumarate reductase subunit D